LNTFTRDELARIRPGGFTAVTIGNFDGVHKGHRFLLDHLVLRARALDLKSLAITLYPNPLRVLRPEIPIFYLTTLEERIRLMRESGLDFVAPLTFTPEVAKLSAADFGRLLYEQVAMRLLVMGPDHSFGRDREGTPDRMRVLGDVLGFEVEQLSEHYTAGADSIHASAIRQALATGDMDAVTEHLGRPYSLQGPVVHGEERGASIGFPTANIAVPADRFLPAFGVYATWAYAGEGRFPSATNIGKVPHFGGEKTTVETFIIDFEGDLYGRDLRIEVVERISGEEAFTTTEALIAKIGADVEKAKEILSR
jgi:riboflavin kinase/FMN adenylyltransferase